jgi:hypothetical protein
MMQNIRDGILRKVIITRDILSIDKDFAAGLYIYAVEEFGKILLLRNAKLINGKRRVLYSSEFTNHKIKFETAFDYFQGNGYNACIALTHGGFSTYGFSWKGFSVGLLANTEARLSIFYSDFVYDDKQNIIIEKLPSVDVDLLLKADNELEKAINQLSVP